MAQREGGSVWTPASPFDRRDKLLMFQTPGQVSEIKRNELPRRGQTWGNLNACYRVRGPEEEAPPWLHTGHSEKDKTTERQEDPRLWARGREGAQGAQGVGAASSSARCYSGNVTTHPSNPQGVHTGGSPLGNGMSSGLMGCSSGPLNGCRWQRGRGALGALCSFSSTVLGAYNDPKR